MQDNSSNKKNSSYDLIFLAEQSIEYANFTHLGYVYTNYVFATDENDAAKAVQFPWLHLPRNINLLIQLVFQISRDFDIKNHVKYSKDNAWVIELTHLLPHAMSTEDAETTYPNWIKQSGRHDNFDEFCAFMGLADYLNRNKGKQQVILSIFEEKNI